MPNTAKKRPDCEEVNSPRSGRVVSVTLFKLRVGEQRLRLDSLQWTLQSQIVARRIHSEWKEWGT
jgi:hypothetical protein